MVYWIYEKLCSCEKEWGSFVYIVREVLRNIDMGGSRGF